jgi:RNA polymerase sigma factor (sigma-70 family)
MVKYSNDELLNGIINNDNLVLQHIYKNFFYKVNLYIKQNSGGDDDANDIFQEAIIVIYRKLKDKSLVLNCAFETYLYSVCKILWYKQLAKRKSNQNIALDSTSIEIEDYDQDIAEVAEKNEKYRLYQKHFQLLGKDCQKLMQLFLDNVSLKQIAQIMGYKSEKYAKKRKYKCKEYLVASIKQDPDFKNFV